MNKIVLMGQKSFPGNSPPTPSLRHNFTLSEKRELMLSKGRGR